MLSPESKDVSEGALSSVRENALNIRRGSHLDEEAPKSKQRKVSGGKENIMGDIHGRGRTMMYSEHEKNTFNRMSRVEDNHTRLLKMSKTIDMKRDEIFQLNSTIMTLKTQNANQRFENFKLDDQLAKLKQEHMLMQDQISELRHHEQESLKSLQSKYELTTRQLNLSQEEKISKLKEKVTKEIEAIINDNVRRSQADKAQLQIKHDDLEKQIKSQEQDLNRRLIKLKEDYNKKLILSKATMDQKIETLKGDLRNLDSTKREVEYQIITTEKDIETEIKGANSELNIQMSDLEGQFGAKEEVINELQRELDDTRDAIEHSKSQSIEKREKIEQLNEKIGSLSNSISNQEYERRYLHNRLQELKGNIRVFCRIRPPNPDVDVSYIGVPDDELNEDASQNLVIRKDNEETTGSYGMRSSPEYKFHFDKIFSSSSTNENVFEEISQLIQSSLDGYNVCVFAYGQTGSGKTYTMLHPENGMITLSIKKIFEDMEDLKSKGWEYSLEGQFLEIYNETLINLLASDPKGVKHEIKHDDTYGRTTVTNLTTIRLTSVTQAESILKRASKNRSTAASKMNERSSRSHSIFILKIKGKNSESGKQCEGTLNLVDLAGSERIANSQVRGDRLKETQAINKSLSCLGDVIFSLNQSQARKESPHHIPYRNSKLTYLLKHSLGGNSKTLMFVNISPMLKDFNESVNSLRFATKVNNTKLNRQNK